MDSNVHNEIDILHNKKRKLKIRYWLLIVSLLSCFLGFIIGIKVGKTNSVDSDVSKVINTLKNEWYSEVFYGDEDTDAILAQFINGIDNFDLSLHLDPYTHLIKNVAATPTYRLGISLTYINDYPMIYHVDEGSPAAEAGLLANDLLIAVKVDDTYRYVNEVNFGYTELLNSFKKELDANIELKVARYDTTNNHYNIIDKVVTMKPSLSISAYEITTTIANTHIVKLTGFEDSSIGEVTASRLNNIIKNYSSDDNLIIDLRNNGGGLLSSVVAVCDLFLDKDKIVAIKENKQKELTYEKTKDSSAYTFNKIIILCNGSTASASEIMITCLDYYLDNVTVVGTKSYGKGIAQKTIAINNDYSLKFTFSKWYDAGMNSIHKVGYVPKDENLIEFTNDYTFYKGISSSGNRFDGSVTIDSVSSQIFFAQRMLNYQNTLGLRTDGYFDNATQQALKDYQTAHNLTNDGIYNEETFLCFCNDYINALNNYDYSYINRAAEVII